MIPSVTFFAAGTPRTKGSTRSFQANGRTVTKSANPKTKAWQGVIAHAAHEAGVELTRGAVGVCAVFYFARPKSHYGTGRNAEVLKESAPPFPVTRAQGDLDKLMRAVLDGLDGVAYADDSQVARTGPNLKLWLPPGRTSEGAQISVWALR